MKRTIYLGNLPTWVTTDDIRSWLNAESLVADSIKVVRDPATQMSQGYAFIDVPGESELISIVRRFDRAPLEDRLLSASPLKEQIIHIGGPPETPSEKSRELAGLRSISTAVRHEVWRRDEGRCTNCGSRERLEFDHIIPVSRGGSNTARNIELLCEQCNRKKAATLG